MNIWEILLTAAGLSLDVYAVCICKGAVIGRIDGKKLTQMCIVFSAWQVCALLAGNLFTLVPEAAENGGHISGIWYGLAAAILLGMGFYMLRKGAKKEPVEERLEAWGTVKEMCVLSAAVSADAFLTGIGFAFTRTRLSEELLAVAVMTAAAVMLGIYTGYRLGYEQKNRAYVVGGVLYEVVGVEVLVSGLL